MSATKIAKYGTQHKTKTTYLKRNKNWAWGMK